MPLAHQTTVPIFIAILIAYIIVCVLIGAKKVYFDPWKQADETPEEKARSSRDQ